MATFTTSLAQAAVPAKSLRVGLTGVCAVFSFDNFSSSIGTQVQMVKVPSGATPLYLQWEANVSGEYTLHIGDSVAPGRYKSSGTHSAGLGAQVSNLLRGYTYSADDTIFMRMSLASVLTLGGAFYMNVIWSMDGR